MYFRDQSIIFGYCTVELNVTCNYHPFFFCLKQSWAGLHVYIKNLNGIKIKIGFCIQSSLHSHLYFIYHLSFFMMISWSPVEVWFWPGSCFNSDFITDPIHFIFELIIMKQNRDEFGKKRKRSGTTRKESEEARRRQSRSQDRK